MNKLSRGSIWRKWDLQVQTILDDGYVSLVDYYQRLKSRYPNKWKKYISEMDSERDVLLYDSKQYFQDLRIDEKERCINYVRNFFAFVKIFEPGISCIGLTDHNYFHDQLIDIFIRYSKDSSLKILGGVEINVGGVHVLVFFPKAPYNKENFSKGIHAFLHKIGINNRITDSNLTVSSKELPEVINKIRGQKGVIIFPHCNSENGLFQERGRVDRTHLSNLYNHQPINILQSHNKKSCEAVKGYINTNPRLKSNFCLTISSDSRSLKDIGRSDDDGNYLWIKADPTFEGLKQIIYEPKERVGIQENSPFEDKKKIHFNSLEFTGTKSFVIPNIKIPLNRELVTIIGGRGSGKSALLESIAFLNEEHGTEDQNRKEKIIEYYRQNIDGKDPTPDFTLTADLVDKDGSPEQYKKNLNEEENLGLPFLYIGQEQLSIKATDDKKLTETICDLLNIDPVELRNSNIIEKGRNLLSSIDITKSEQNDLLDKYPDYQNGNFVDWITKQLLKKEEQRKKLSSQKTKDLLGEINSANDKKLKLIGFYKELESLKENLGSIDVNDQIKEINEDQSELYGADSNLIPLINLNPQDRTIGELSEKARKDIRGINSLIEEKKNFLSKLGLKEDVSVLLQSAETIQREINNIKYDKKHYGELRDLLKGLMYKRNKLFDLIQSYLEKNKKQIDDKFVEFKKSRDSSSRNEKELFNSIIDSVGIEGKINFNQEKFCDDILRNFIDRRIIKTVTDLKLEIAGTNDKGEVKEITLESLKNWIDNRLEGFISSGALTQKGCADLLKYLFTGWREFLSVNAVVKLGGLPTPKLSVGQRGTLLLKIYLATASIKQIFIVDQPEDNLDNQFIMNELVPLIRKIKKSRQMILSTHNANLVVNSDAEQIIVACLDSEKDDYISGGIENPIINKNIKEILEGGEEAFRNRENKYGMGRS